MLQAGGLISKGLPATVRQQCGKSVLTWASAQVMVTVLAYSPTGSSLLCRSASRA